ncbi:MAG TPA: hypothetical protein VF365_11080 [Candidatus Limnocylindria bacterium]
MTTPRTSRWALAVPIALATLLLTATVPVDAAPAPAVRGGGVVAGDLGVTSQLGFTASTTGGSLLCVMAGRSGGFPFDQWDEILQMQVQGRVTPGTLEINGAWSSFEGVARIDVVGVAGGEVVKATMLDVNFVSTQGAGGAGVAWHLLELPDLELAFGPAPMASGHISIRE